MSAKRHLTNSVTAAVLGLSSLAFVGTALGAVNAPDANSNQGTPTIGHTYGSGNSAVGDTYNTANGTSHAGGISVLMQNNQQASGGITHAKVKAAQIALNNRGYNLKANGTFDPATFQAIMNYQQTHNLRTTGHPDQQTLQSLGVT